MKATVKTKSNFKNANGVQLDVVAFCGTIVALKVPMYDFDKGGNPEGKMVTADFTLSEIQSINS